MMVLVRQVSGTVNCVFVLVYLCLCILVYLCIYVFVYLTCMQWQLKVTGRKRRGSGPEFSRCRPADLNRQLYLLWAREPPL